jgi:hypothetical protein
MQAREPRQLRALHLHPKKAQSQVPSTLVLLKNSSIGGRAGRGHTPTWAPSLSPWKLGLSPSPRGCFGTSWGLGTPPPPSWAHSTASGINYNSETCHHDAPSTRGPNPVSILFEGPPAPLTCPQWREMDREGKDWQRLAQPGRAMLHSHRVGAQVRRDGHSEGQPQDPASHHKVPPVQEALPTSSLPQSHMCTLTHAHALIHMWIYPHTCMRTWPHVVYIVGTPVCMLRCTHRPTHPCAQVHSCSHTHLLTYTLHMCVLTQLHK